MLFFVIQVQMSLSTDRLTITFNYSIFFQVKMTFFFRYKILLNFSYKFSVNIGCWRCWTDQSWPFDMMAISNCLQGFAQGGWSQSLSI